MLNRKVLLEKMNQLGIDWISHDGFLDEGQVSHVLDLVEKESGLTPRALDLPNESVCICGKPIKDHQGVVCLPESASQ